MNNKKIRKGGSVNQTLVAHSHPGQEQVNNGIVTMLDVAGKKRLRDCLRRHLAQLETEAIITTWPGCPAFASRRVDVLTLEVQP